MFKMVNQYFTLLSRNFRVQFADHFGMMLTLLLPPVIALLLIIAFWLIGNDTRENNNQMMAAQIFFDITDIARNKMPVDRDSKVTLAIYQDDDASQALDNFKDDFYLYICLGSGISDRNKKIASRSQCDRAAENIWSKVMADEIVTYSTTNNMDFLWNFSLFLYNLPETGKEESNGQLKWPYQVSENTKMVLTRRAEAFAELRTRVSGEEAARSNMTVFFILIAAAIWMGLLPACKEIVSEWDIFLCESRCKVSSIAFLFSKFTVLAVITAVQNIILVLIICRMWQNMPLVHCLTLYVVLLLTSICATSVGLLISSITTTLRAGLMIIPMVMVAQLILGGLLRLPAQTRDDAMKPVRIAACKSTIQYWAFEAVTGCIARLPECSGNTRSNTTLFQKNVMTIKRPDDSIKYTRKELNSFMKSEFLPLDNYIFGQPQPCLATKLIENMELPRIISERDSENFKFHVIRPLGYLLLKSIAILFLTWIWLKLRLKINYHGGILPLIFRV